MDKITIWSLVCMFISLFGFYVAYLYGRHTKKFHWGEYFAIIFAPIIGVLIMISVFGYKILILFIISMLVGTVAEYLFGFVYEKTLNKKLWVYKRFSINGYSSYLSIPVWGVAGVIFWAVGKFVGL